MPDFAALDLEANDAGALDCDYEVDLVILEVVGDPLAGNYQVEGLKLFDQRLVDKALGAVGEAWGLGRRDGHRLAGSTPSNQSRMSEPSPLGVLAWCDVDDGIEGGVPTGSDRSKFEASGSGAR